MFSLCLQEVQQALDPLKLELHMAVSHHVGARSSVRTTSALNHCAIIQVPLKKITLNNDNHHHHLSRKQTQKEKAAVNTDPCKDREPKPSPHPSRDAAGNQISVLSHGRSFSCFSKHSLRRSVLCVSFGDCNLLGVRLGLRKW